MVPDTEKMSNFSSKIKKLSSSYTNTFLIVWRIVHFAHISYNPSLPHTHHFNTWLLHKGQFFSVPNSRHFNTNLSNLEYIKCFSDVSKRRIYVAVTDLCRSDVSERRIYVKVTDLSLSDMFKWRILEAVKEWPLCGSDVLKWCVRGSKGELRGRESRKNVKFQI